MGTDEPQNENPEKPCLQTGPSKRSVVPFSFPARFVFFWVGVVVPVGAFAIGLVMESELSGLQSGEISAYSSLLLSPRTCQVFFPLLLFAIGCFLFLLIDPYTYGQKWGVRMGLYSGIVMAMHLAVLWQFSFANKFDPYDVEKWLWNILVVCPTVCLGVVVLPCAWWMLNSAAWQSLERFDWVTLLLVVPAVAVDVGLLVWLEGNLLAILFCFLLGTVMVWPYWMFGAYVAVAVHVVRIRWAPLRFHLRDLMIAITWIAAYMAAWREATVRMFELYAEVP